jgi:hypothetical protein
MFRDADTLNTLINIFFALAAASVALAFVAISILVRERRPARSVSPSGAVVVPVRITGPTHKVA